MNYLLIVFIPIAAIAKATMDTLQFHFDKSIFKGLNDEYWNPSISWIRKWKDSSATEEKFIGSSTILVAVTDAWHLFQSMFLSCIFISIVLYKSLFLYTDLNTVNKIIDLIILRSIFG